MMLDEQVKSWSQRGHIDSLTEPVGGVDSKKNAHLVSSSTSAMPNVIGHGLERSIILSYLLSLVVTAIILIVVNYFIRVSSPSDTHSTGFIVDFIRTEGLLKSIIWFLGVSLIVYIFPYIYYFFKGLNRWGFWRLVAKNPDAAYHWFKESPVWKVLDYPLPSNYQQDVPEDKWAGPFDLYVPELHSRVCIFGLSDEYYNSQLDFIEHMKTLNIRTRNKTSGTK